MSNNEKFNALLNSCSNPRRTCNALAALAEDKPNLWRVAEEVSKFKNPDKVLNALQSILSAKERCGPEGRQQERGFRQDDNTPR